MNAAPTTPKRKRADHPVNGSFDKTAQEEQDDAASPRSRVISKFKDLQLRQSGSPCAAEDASALHNNGSISPRKRSRFGQDEDAARTINGGLQNVDVNGHSDSGTEVVRNVPVNLQAQFQDHSLETSPAEQSFAPMITDVIDTAGSTKASTTSTSTSPKTKRKISPPPPSKATNKSRLVWHDSEITGHLMDDPEDDGVGINGIGFKPTTAIAYARQQKRKQQIAEWKARETREARQKRSERRLKGETEDAKSIDTSNGASEDGTKAVRFA